MDSSYGARRRAAELILAVLLLLPILLVMLMAIVAIRLTSRGPAIFRQRRVGLGEAEFTLYKFRTMFIEMDNRPSHMASADDITPLGKWLRRTKIDELPQIINVLRGDMSFVGPRPCLPSQTQLIEERRARGVYRLRPGITGLAQLSGIDMSDPQRLAAIDASYVQQAGVALDSKLLWQTLTGAGAGDAIKPAA